MEVKKVVTPDLTKPEGTEVGKAHLLPKPKVPTPPASPPPPQPKSK